MKASNDLVEKYGWDKIIHGLVGLLIVAICVLVAVFLFGNKFVPVLAGVAIGTGCAYIAAKWKEAQDDIPDEKDIKATLRGAYLADLIIGVAYVFSWIINTIF